MSTIRLAPAPGTAQPAPVGAQPAPTGQQFVLPNIAEVNVEIGGSIESVRQEVDDAYADLATFLNREPDEVMRMCSGHSARMSELRTRISRVEDYFRQWRPIREREIEPLIREIQFQYDVASRRHTVREFDYKVETSGT